MHCDRKFEWGSNMYGIVKIEFTENIKPTRTADYVVDFSEELSCVPQLHRYRDFKYLCITCKCHLTTPLNMEIAMIMGEFLKKFKPTQKAYMFMQDRRRILSDPYLKKCRIWDT